MNKILILFPLNLENQHLTKDVVKLPQFFSNENNLEMVIFCRKNMSNNVDINIIQTNIKNNILFLFLINLKIIYYNLIYFKNIKVILTFFWNSYFLPAIFISKFVNKCFLINKLDFNPHLFDSNNTSYLSFLLDNIYLKTIDLFTVENIIGLNYLKNTFINYGEKFEYLPSGVDGNEILSLNPPISKKNIILVVGRLGAKMKGHHVFFKSLEFLQLSDWKIRFIGSMSVEFRNELIHLISLRPDLNSNIEVIESIYDRQLLFKLFSECKVLVHPSINTTNENESFALVIPESIALGLYVITTNAVPSAPELLDKRFGKIIIQNDEFALADAITDVISYPEICRFSEEFGKDFILTNFSWKKLTTDLLMYMKSRGYE